MIANTKAEEKVHDAVESLIAEKNLIIKVLKDEIMILRTQGDSYRDQLDRNSKHTQEQHRKIVDLENKLNTHFCSTTYSVVLLSQKKVIAEGCLRAIEACLKTAAKMVERVRECIQ